METALFGMGCFWGAERLYWQVRGVWVTAVGYAGGFKQNPTYAEVCSGRTGHAEVVRVVFDPVEVTYGLLLKLFWEEHDPTQGNDRGTQYRSLIGVDLPEDSFPILCDAVMNRREQRTARTAERQEMRVRIRQQNGRATAEAPDHEVARPGLHSRGERRVDIASREVTVVPSRRSTPGAAVRKPATPDVAPPANVPKGWPVIGRDGIG